MRITDFITEKCWKGCDLLDQVIMATSPDAFAQFQARLDMLPKPNDRLRKTMLTPAPWERE